MPADRSEVTSVNSCIVVLSQAPLRARSARLSGGQEAPVGRPPLPTRCASVTFSLGPAGWPTRPLQVGIPPYVPVAAVRDRWPCRHLVPSVLGASTSPRLSGRCPSAAAQSVARLPIPPPSRPPIAPQQETGSSGTGKQKPQCAAF